jgi:Baseplate J-like protein
MPLTIPAIDGRTYDELRDEALRRIPVHNPDWTNFNASDPGVTLVELFAFMTENLLYRSNQIPERNRRKFLSLLGVPLQAASPAHGIVTFSNDRGPLETLTLSSGVEVRAGNVGFRTDIGLDLLPVEHRVYMKARVAPDPAVLEQYRQLYASYARPGRVTADVTLYQTKPLTPESNGVDIVRDTVDRSLWVALLARPADKAASPKPTDVEAARAAVRAAIGGRILSLGVVPIVPEQTARLGPGTAPARARDRLRFSVPNPATDGLLPSTPSARVPSYRVLDASGATNVLTDPGVVQIALPQARWLGLWTNLDPLESGVGDFPPPLEETALNDRLLTWLRIEATSSQPTGILWAGINAAPVTQRVPVLEEPLADGTGDPDQVARLSRRPVVPGSVQLAVTVGDSVERWQETADLATAGAEVALPDASTPPGRLGRPPAPAHVYLLDAEAGELRFGDGDRGRRPPLGATMRASYDVSDGAAGNVGPAAISAGPTLPPGVKVANPVRTWGGADAETVSSGEKRITRFLQHGERLVTELDHRTIASATPEVDVARVEVLPAFDPGLTGSRRGDAPGAVTLMVVPRLDPVQPDAPRPDKFFLDAICRHLDPRRLVTSELFLRGPDYQPIVVSVGIEPEPERSIAEVREAVRRTLMAFLSPLPAGGAGLPPFAHSGTGWPLGHPVRKLELDTVAGRVTGVLYIRDVLLAGADGVTVDQIEMSGLQLPRVAAISVVAGDPEPIAQLQGVLAAPGDPGLLAVPLTPEAC